MTPTTQPGDGGYGQAGGPGLDVPDADFRTLLRGFRLHACLTQEELAERSGLSTRALSDLERGVRAPRATTVGLLSSALALPAGAASQLDDAARMKRFMSRELPDKLPGARIVRT